MPDNDPGNSGGSIIIPSPPTVKSRNWFKCETCGEKLATREAFDVHLQSHFGPHPALITEGLEAPSALLIADQGILDSLEARNVTRLEMFGTVVEPRKLRDALARTNGRHEFELILVGRAEHVRRVYQVQVAILSPANIESIEADFLASLNRPGVEATDLEKFTHRWLRLPERTYADALAAFRLAITMRDDPKRISRVVERMDYRHHLAEARRSLAAVTTSLANTIKAASCFIVNDFSPSPRRLWDPRFTNGLVYLRHIVQGSDLTWVSRRPNQSALVLDLATHRLLDAIEMIRAGNKSTSEALREVLAMAGNRGDLMTAKKAAAALMHQGVLGQHVDILAGDPVFTGVLARTHD